MTELTLNLKSKNLNKESAVIENLIRRSYERDSIFAIQSPIVRQALINILETPARKTERSPKRHEYKERLTKPSEELFEGPRWMLAAVTLGTLVPQLLVPVTAVVGLINIPYFFKIVSWLGFEFFNVVQDLGDAIERIVHETPPGRKEVLIA